MTKKLMVGRVAVGGGAPVSIQSMCNTKTDDVDATVAQIRTLADAGCEIIRVAVPDEAAAMAVDAIAMALFKRKVPEKYQAAINTAGFVLLMGFMMLVTFHDVFKLVK